MSGTASATSSSRDLWIPTQLAWELAANGLSCDGEMRPVERFCPDGSSASLDDIEGIRIGISGPEYRPRLPANLHDFRYWWSRNHEMVPWTRQEADAEYRDGCLRCVSILVGFSGWKARKRCWARYWGLRAFGRAAWGHSALGFGARVWKNRA